MDGARLPPVQSTFTPTVKTLSIGTESEEGDVEPLSEELLARTNLSHVTDLALHGQVCLIAEEENSWKNIKSLALSEDVYRNMSGDTIRSMVKALVPPAGSLRRLDLGGIHIAVYYDGDEALEDLKWLDPLMRSIEDFTLPTIVFFDAPLLQAAYHLLSEATSLKHLTIVFSILASEPDLPKYIAGSLDAVTTSLTTLTVQVSDLADMKVEPEVALVLHKYRSVPVLKDVDRIVMSGFMKSEIRNLDERARVD